MLLSWENILSIRKWYCCCYYIIHPINVNRIIISLPLRLNQVSNKRLLPTNHKKIGLFVVLHTTTTTNYFICLTIDQYPQCLTIKQDLTWVSQKFCNILVTSGTIWLLQILLLMLWTWWSLLNCVMLSLPDTLQMLLTEFSSMAWSMSPEYTVLDLPNLSYLSRLLETEKNFLNHPVLYWYQLCLYPLHNRYFWLLQQFVCLGFIAYQSLWVI